MAEEPKPRTDMMVEATRSLLLRHMDGEAMHDVAVRLDAQLLERSRKGIVEHGRPLDEHPVDFPVMLRHPTEEFLDAANYLMTLHAWSGKASYRQLAEIALQAAMVLEADKEIFETTGSLPDD